MFTAWGLQYMPWVDNANSETNDFWKHTSGQSLLMSHVASGCTFTYIVSWQKRYKAKQGLTDYSWVRFQAFAAV